MQRKKRIGKSLNREEQFNNIISEKEKFMQSDTPMLM